MESNSRHHMLLIVAAAAAMIYLYGHVPYTLEPFRDMDLHYYRLMAQASPRLASDIPRPFAYRLLGPWIAGLLPGPDPVGFLAVTIAVSLSIPVLLYRFLVEFGITRSSAFVAALLFVFNKYLFGSSTWNFFQVKDSMSLLCIAGCFITMLRGSWPLFSLSLLVGTLSGEAPLIMAPVLLAYLAERRRPLSEWRRAVLALIPGIAGFLLLHQIVPARGGTGLIESFLFFSRKLRYPVVWVGLLANPFVPLVLLPLVHIRDARDFIKNNRYLMICFVLVFFSTLFGSNNERLMAPALVTVYAFIGLIAERHWRGNHRLLLVIIAACFFASGHYLLARYPILPSRAATRTIAAVMTLAVTAASYSLSRSQAGRGSGLNADP